MNSETKNRIPSGIRFQWSNIRWPVLAFLIPFLIIWIGFAYHDVYPFGDKQILVVDAWHQYYPFLMNLRDKLIHGESLFYSWNGGLGTNFLSLSAYYCFSPFNLLLPLFPASHLYAGFAFLVSCKLGLAGMCCAIALQKGFKRNDFSVAVFGSCYGLCSFFMGYYWNIMWLDTVALMPLVALGTLCLVREGKFRLYVVSLALCLLCNYLIGLYVCIFTFFLFFVLCFCQKLSLKQFGTRFCQIGIYTVIAIAITAFLLLPAFMGLMSTNSASAAGKFPSGLHEDFVEVLSNLMLGAPTAKEGLPNLYCGLPCVLLGVLYLISPKIPWRQKVSALFLLVLLTLSMNVKVLEYIWNGFHSTNMIPYRFSFLFSFVLIVMSFQVAPEIFKLPIWIYPVLLAVGAELLIFGADTHSKELLIANGVLMAVYIGAVLILHSKPRVLSLILCVTLLGELTAFSIIGVKEVRTTDTSIYPKNQAEISRLLEIIEAHDDGFYRLECIPWQTLNDPFLLGYRGVSVFSSAARVDVIQLMEKLGFVGNPRSNRYFNAYIPSPIVSAMLGMKYFISKSGPAADSIYLEEIAAVDGIPAYLNHAALPLGFMTHPDAAQELVSEKNPFLTQNNLFTSLTGMEEELYDLVDIIHVGHKNLKVTRSDLGCYTYTVEDKAQDATLKYNYEMPRSGLLYGYVKCDNISSFNVLNQENSTNYKVYKLPYVFCAGYFEEGEIVSFKWKVPSDAKDGSKMNIFVGMLNQEVFDKGLATLSDEGLQVDEFTSTSVSGTIDVKQDGYFYTSIPYESGWSLYVDGQKREITPYQNAFVALDDLEEGLHSVELKYSPAGFLPGVAVSLTGAALFAAAILLERKRRKNGIPEEPLPPQDAELSENEDEVMELSEDSDESADGQ